MKDTTELSLWGMLEGIMENMKHKRLAEVFRFVSFHPFEKYGPHTHLRIEINYVKKGNCILHLEHESIHFKENEMMIIGSNVEHTFEAGSVDTTLMQLEFVPEIFQKFNPISNDELTDFAPLKIFSEENKLIKIVNNVRIMRAVQRIVNEMHQKNKGYQYLVIMYYAELLILIYRYMDESYLPICTNESLKKAIAYIRVNYQRDLSIQEVSSQLSIGERYLRKLFTQYLNMSPIEYINQLKINKALELLKNTEMSIKEICFVCGFQSPQYFSKVFKQQIGISPRDISR